MHTLAIDVDRILCDGHGLCAELLPEHIRLDDRGYPILQPGPVPPTSPATPVAPPPPAPCSRCGCARPEAERAMPTPRLTASERDGALATSRP
jgi:hypothetical protein